MLCHGQAWRRAQALVYAAAAAAWVLWCAQHVGWPLPLQAALTLAAGGLVGWGTAAALCAPALQLQWTGQQWQHGSEPVQLQLMWLGSRWALIRLRSAGGTRWLATGAQDAGPQWHALRVALLAQAEPPTDAMAGGQGL